MGFRLEQRVGVAAPAHVVWEVVADLPRWGEWNAMYPRIEGRLAIGAPLEATLVIPGQKPQTIHPVILDWAPDEQLAWNLKLFGGLIRTTRYIELEKLNESACILANGEIFDGLGAGLMPRPLRANVMAGFKTMAEALKARAEGRWAAQAGGG